MANKTNCTINGINYYRIRAKIGSNEYGKSIMKPFYGTGKKDAETQRDTYLDSIKAGLDMDLSKLTVAAAMKSWLFEVKRVDNDLKATSFARYECSYRNTIIGTKLGSMLVPEVKSIHIQRYLNAMLKDNKSHQQMKNAYKVLRMFYAYATAEGYTLKSPCQRISLPGDKPKKIEVETFTDEEIERIRVGLTSHRLRFLILLALGTGMRKGELLSLKYADIRNGKVYVKTTMAMPTKVDANGGRKRVREIWEPKSESSHRVIPFPSDLTKELDSHRAKQLNERLAIGIGGDPEYIFNTETAQFYDPTNVYVAYGRLLIKSGVTHKKFHALRHTYASRLIKAGVNLPGVQKLLGHSKIEMTMIYVHTNIDDLTEDVQVLNSWFK